jgi:hypothetical protein
MAIGSLHRLGLSAFLEAESDEATSGVRPHHGREQEARRVADSGTVPVALAPAPE